MNNKTVESLWLLIEKAEAINEAVCDEGLYQEFKDKVDELYLAVNTVADILEGKS